jgi:hypothetical protein
MGGCHSPALAYLSGLETELGVLLGLLELVALK